MSVSAWFMFGVIAVFALALTIAASMESRRADRVEADEVHEGRRRLRLRRWSRRRE